MRKKNLSPRELSAQTGLSEEEVFQILQKTGWDLVPKASVPAFLRGAKGASWVCGSLLILAVVFCYLPVLKNDFVNWDDKDNILGNLQIRNLDGASLRWMLTTFHTGNWMPLTELSFALNYRFGGLDPRFFHATNVFFHALNTLLVFWIGLRLIKRLPEAPGNSSALRDFGLPIAFLTALLFGLHPAHVESVAWATERKDVLYSFFYLGALGLYLGEPFEFDWRGFKPWACLGLYLLALMSKPMAITLPMVYLVFDFWPLERWKLGWRKILQEKAPFFVAALGALWVTMASHEKTLSYAKSGVEFFWVMNAFRSLVFYLLKMAFPVGLTAYYPFPPEMGGFYLFENFSAAAAVLLISILLFRRRRQAPAFAAAWLFYVVVLLPVIGIIQTGSQAAADRYVYLASLGFFLPLAAGAARLVSYRWIPFALLTVLAAGLLGWRTMEQIGTWKNSEVLWQRVTEIYPDENPTAYSQLGAAYIKAKRYDEALAAYTRAAVIPPPLATTFNDLGKGLLYKERVPEAIQEFEYALTLDPSFAEPHLNLWIVYEHQGRHEEAVAQMQAALQLEPKSPVFHNNLGVSYVFLKKNQEARPEFEEAHRLDPDNSEYLVNLATLEEWAGQFEKAMEWYRSGIRRHPREPVYYLKMADLYLSHGLKAKAFEKLQTAWNLNPNNPKVIQQIGEDFDRVGRADLAEQCYSKEKTVDGGKDLRAVSTTNSTP